MSQADQVLAYLRAGNTITPLEAFEFWACLALHSRAAELRSKGHDIRCAIRTHQGRRWGEYWLA